MRMGPRRRIVASVSSLVMIAASCGTAGGSGSDATPITIMVSGDPEEIEAYRAVVDAFDDSQEVVDAQLIPIAERDELIARLSTAIAGDAPPDLFLMNYRYYGQFAARGALEPMGAMLERSDAFSPEDFYEEALFPFRWRGEQMCLPQNVASLVVYYNRDLFRSAGIPLPRDDWTWDDMLRAARRSTRDTDRDGNIDVFGVGVDPEIIRVAPLAWSNGGDIVDDPEEPTRLSFDARGVLALQELLDLRAVEEVTPSDEEAEAEALEDRFLNGRLAMLFESRRVVPTLRTIHGFDWDVASLPRFRDPVSILHSDAYCITAGSTAKAAAWRFVEFALGPEGQRITALAGRTVPSIRSVAESDAFLDPSSDPANSIVFLEQIPGLRSVPTISTWPEVEDIANGLLEEGYYAGARAVELAIEMDLATRDAFARAAT
jgi:multiple sugar transport system substrate-binding protein